MAARSITEAPRIFPTFRCADASAMIDWLVDNFGFTVRARYMDGDRVGHAELAFGSSIVMLGDAGTDTYGQMLGTPGDPGGKSLYVAVDDPDALYERAKAAGAKLEEGPADSGYGSRGFVCRDLEGNVWSFGTYWPKVDEAG